MGSQEPGVGTGGNDALRDFCKKLLLHTGCCPPLPVLPSPSGQPVEIMEVMDRSMPSTERQALHDGRRDISFSTGHGFLDDKAPSQTRGDG